MSQISLDELQDKLWEAVEVLALDIDVTFKPMFGGRMGYYKGKVFASLSNVGLALKLSTNGQEALLKQVGAKRLQYEPDAPESKQYIVVPEAMLNSRDELSLWVKQSVDFIAAQPAPKPKKKPA